MPNYLFVYDLYMNLNTHSNLQEYLSSVLKTSVEYKQVIFNNRKYAHITFQTSCKSDIEELNNHYIKILSHHNITVKHHRIIYLGIRNYRFTHFIYKLLLTSNLKPSIINTIINDQKIMTIYDQVFTHKSVSTNNYEFYEFYGDVTLNKAVVMYICNKFKHLNKPTGVAVLTRVKHNLISKRYFAKFAEELDFWKYISISLKKKQTNMKRTLEDVFESFFGATEMILNTYIKKGIGFYFCSKMIFTILSKHTISLSYNVVVDAVTRLKELVDVYGDLQKTNDKYLKKLNDEQKSLFELIQIEKDYISFLKYSKPVRRYFPNGLGKIVYKNDKEPIENSDFFKHKMTIFLCGKYIATGTASIKQDAKQNVSEKVLEYLKRMNIIKPTPNYYT